MFQSVFQSIFHLLYKLQHTDTIDFNQRYIFIKKQISLIVFNDKIFRCFALKPKIYIKSNRNNDIICFPHYINAEAFRLMSHWRDLFKLIDLSLLFSNRLCLHQFWLGHRKMKTISELRIFHRFCLQLHAYPVSMQTNINNWKRRTKINYL